MPSTCWNTLLIEGTDVREYGEILSAEGLLGNGPIRADIISMDWLPGAIAQIGPRGTYTFEVPLILTGGTQDVRLGNLRQVQAWQGTQVTLTRRLTVDGADIDDTCEAVMVSAPQVQWDFGSRAAIRVILIFQVLSPWTT